MKKLILLITLLVIISTGCQEKHEYTVFKDVDGTESIFPSKYVISDNIALNEAYVTFRNTNKNNIGTNSIGILSEVKLFEKYLKKNTHIVVNFPFLPPLLTFYGLVILLILMTISLFFSSILKYSNVILSMLGILIIIQLFSPSANQSFNQFEKQYCYKKIFTTNEELSTCSTVVIKPE